MVVEVLGVHPPPHLPHRERRIEHRDSPDVRPSRKLLDDHIHASAIQTNVALLPEHDDVEPVGGGGRWQGVPPLLLAEKAARFGWQGPRLVKARLHLGKQRSVDGVVAELRKKPLPGTTRPPRAFLRRRLQPMADSLGEVFRSDRLDQLVLDKRCQGCHGGRQHRDAHRHCIDHLGRKLKARDFVVWILQQANEIRRRHQCRQLLERLVGDEPQGVTAPRTELLRKGVFRWSADDHEAVVGAAQGAHGIEDFHHPFVRPWRAHKQHHFVVGPKAKLEARFRRVVPARIELRLVARMGHRCPTKLGGKCGVGDEQPVCVGQKTLGVARPRLLEGMRQRLRVQPCNVRKRVAIAEERQFVVVHIHQQRTIAKCLQHQPELHARQPRLARHHHIRIDARRESFKGLLELWKRRAWDRHGAKRRVAQGLPHRVAIAQELEAEQNDGVASRQRFGDQIRPAEWIVAHVPGDDGDGDFAAEPWGGRASLLRWRVVFPETRSRQGAVRDRQRNALEVSVFSCLLTQPIRRGGGYIPKQQAMWQRQQCMADPPASRREQELNAGDEAIKQSRQRVDPSHETPAFKSQRRPGTFKFSNHALAGALPSVESITLRSGIPFRPAHLLTHLSGLLPNRRNFARQVPTELVQTLQLTSRDSTFSLHAA